MDRVAFSQSPVGQLIPIEGYDPRHQREYRHVAFCPTPLPEQVELQPETWVVVTQAMGWLGRLDQASRQVPNPALLRRPAIRKEAVSTSALEGTHAAFTDVLQAEADRDVSHRSPEVVEILNYVSAAEYAFDSVLARGLTVGLLSELQAILVQGTPAEKQDAGRIRTHQVLIGPETCPVEEARFVPPPHGDLLESGFRQWERWVATTRDMPSVVQAALAHYQFETLHPYHDGNGRIGRLAVALQLMLLGDLQEPLLTVSPWLERRREEYQDRLLEVSRTGDFDQWVRFFCNAIWAQAEQTVQKIDELLSLRSEIAARIREVPIRGVGQQIAEDLIGQPVTTPTYASDLYNVSYPAANQAIARLVDLGLLKELTGRNYGRMFGCRRVIDILDA